MVELKIDLSEKHSISPYLYMQFMEPLGVCDSSVDAAWDFSERDWYPSVIEKVRDLAPPMVRFGGCFASYYHWREAIGDYSKRVPMVNYCWNGIYNNQVGTHEFIDFCRRVGSEPLLVVNMESDGRRKWSHPKNDTVRLGTDTEAAEWVDYCNDPLNAERIKNGAERPFGVKYWQIGNETSYDSGGFNAEQTVEVTKRFVDKMRAADPTIKLIGWGDYSSRDKSWARRMSEVDGIDMIAFHHHIPPESESSPFKGVDYRKDYSVTWEHLQRAYRSLDEHIAELRAECGNKRLAMTEGHFVFPGRNRNEVLSTWGAGAAYARCLNVIMRHSDVLDIATMADFFGNVWQVNALIIPTPIGAFKPYLQPVGAVMRLFSKHHGEKYLDIKCSGNIDATASKTGNKVFIHLTNTSMTETQKIKPTVDGGYSISAIRMHCIAADAETEITPNNTDVFDPITTDLHPGDEISVPPAAVAVLELSLD